MYSEPSVIHSSENKPYCVKCSAPSFSAAKSSLLTFRDDGTAYTAFPYSSSSHPTPSLHFLSNYKRLKEKKEKRRYGLRVGCVLDSRPA